MAYSPIKNDRCSPEAIPGLDEVDLGDGSDTDVESGQPDAAADETTPFVGRWPRAADPRLSRSRYQGRARRDGPATTPLISSLIPWVINLILAIALVSLSWKKAGSTTSGSHLPPTDLLWTMAQDKIQYRLEKTYASQDSPQSDYQGWPNDEIDRLWEQYEAGGSLRIDKHTAEKLPYPTEHVAVPGHEHEHLAGVAVFHQLHCLNAVRKALWPGRYNTSLLDADGSVRFSAWNHIDHCIEVIRRSITCHSDLAALTYDWVEGSQLVPHQETLHTCRNFDLVSEWAYARSVAVPMRDHVEDGRVVSYMDRPYGPEWDKVRTKKPEGWNYTKEDF